MQTREPTRRIVITSPYTLPHIGGVEVLVDQEVRTLASQGHEVVVVTSSQLGNGDNPQYPDNVRVVRVPSWGVLERRFGLFFPLFSPSLFVALWKEIGRCDVVHGHGFLALNTIMAIMIAVLRGKPSILTEHNGLQARRSNLATWAVWLFVHTISRLTVRLSGRCVTYNSRVEATLRRLGGKKKDVRFVPYPIDTELFRPPTTVERAQARVQLGWSDRRWKVLFVGRLVPEKGIPILLEIVSPQEYDLVFCGHGDVGILGALPRAGVEYFAGRPRSQLLTLYHAADVLVLPSYVEGFPLVAREAMACGLPVVLAYDEGYEPYRSCPLLTLCESTPANVKAAIQELQRLARAPSERNLPNMNQSLDDSVGWVKAIYQFPGAAD